MSKYIKYSLIFVFALCSMFIFKQQSLQAVTADDLSSLIFYDIKNSTKDNPVYYSFTNTYLKGLFDTAYNTDGFDVNTYKYFVCLQYNNTFTFLFSNNNFNFDIKKYFNVLGNFNGYMLSFSSSVDFAKVDVTVSEGSANMSSVEYRNDNGFRYIYFYSGVSTNLSFNSVFGTKISATQYTAPTLTWSGNYNTNYSLYTLYAQINTPNKIKYFVNDAGSDKPTDTKDFPSGGKLQVTNDCKIFLYGVDENGTRCTANYEVDVTQIRQSERGWTTFAASIFSYEKMVLQLI